MIETALLVLTFVFAIADWIGTGRSWVKARYFTKPAVLLALIAWFSVTYGWRGMGLWFGLALVLSLLGDINLMLPERYFLPGLLAFLLAHVLYILGFNQSPLNPDPMALVIIVLVAAAGLRILMTVRSGLVRTSEGRKLQVPMILYTLAICVMLISAWSCLFRPGWPLDAALLAGGGALLFFVSDSVLAYTRFVDKIPHNNLLVMTTYHLGQIGIIAGVSLVINAAV